jgi:hypothetical protein
MAITKVQSVQGQGTKAALNSVKAKGIFMLPVGKGAPKQTAKNTTKRA